MRDAVEKDTAPTDNREEGTGQRILGQFHISVEENNVVVTHLGDAIIALFWRCRASRSALTGWAAVSESASRHRPCRLSNRRRYDDLVFSVVVLVDK